MAVRTTQVIIVSACLFTACSTTQVTVEVLNPPEVDLRKSEAHMVVVSRIDPDSLEFDNENKAEVYKLALENYLNGLRDGFDTSLNLTLTIVPEVYFPSGNPREDAMPLSPDQVKRIIRSHRADFVLSIEKVNLWFARSTEKDEEDVKTMQSFLTIAVTNTLYDDDGNVYRRVWDQNDVLHDTRVVESGLLAIGPSLGKAAESARLISYDLGKWFNAKFFPKWSSEHRTFYVHKEYGSVLEAFEWGRWEEVERLLIPWTEHHDRKLSGHAAWDLSVTYQAAGDHSKAKTWSQRARELLGSGFPGD